MPGENLPKREKSAAPAESPDAEVRNALTAIGIPEEKIEAVYSALQVVRVSFSGPLPPPGMLREYNKAAPGCADRIVRMTEENQSRRLEIVKNRQDAQNKLLLRGQAFSFAVAVFALIGGCVLVALGSPIVGSILSIGSLVGCAALYIRGEFQHRQNSEKERQ